MKATKVAYLILLSSLCLSVSNIARADGDTLSVVGAWYGVAGETDPRSHEQLNRVQFKLQNSVVNNTINIPADMNGYFGFDPSFGKVKEVSVTVNYRGYLKEVRQTEGKPLKFPGTPDVDYREISNLNLNPNPRQDNSGRSDNQNINPTSKPPVNRNSGSSGGGSAAR